MKNRKSGPPRTSLLGKLLRFLFHLLYYPLAWSYDLVAWVVSLGHWRSWVLSTLPFLSGPRVLELGHGPGHLQFALHKEGRGAFGLDLSPAMGRQAGHRLRSAGHPPSLVRARAQELPFPTASFDQLVSTFPSEYIFDARTLSEVNRLLQPGGQYVILPTAWLNLLQPLRSLILKFVNLPQQAAGWDTAFAQALHEAGFSVREHRIPVGKSTVLIFEAQKPAGLIQYLDRRTKKVFRNA